MENSSINKPVAVIILNWNGYELLQTFLPAVLFNTNTDIADVFVADNGSTDNSLHLLKTQFSGRIKLIQFSRNYGFAEGYNRAIKQCAGYQYTVLLNSDVEPEIGWIEKLYQFMERHPDTGACQPKILSFHDKNSFEYAGACGGFIDKHGYPYCRGRIFGTCEKDYGQYDKEMNIFWASGAALMVRTELYNAAGGLDPLFFAHMEEIDLCWRIRLAGYEISVVPEACVYHLGGGSLPAENPKKTYLNFRNNLLMLHKNLPDNDRGPILFRRRLLDTLAFFKYVATLDLANAKAIVKAHMDFKKMRKDYTIHPSINILPESPGGNTDILYQYYLRRIHFYSHLPQT